MKATIYSKTKKTFSGGLIIYYITFDLYFGCLYVLYVFFLVISSVLRLVRLPAKWHNKDVILIAHFLKAINIFKFL